MCKKNHNKTDALNRTENYNQRKVTMENNRVVSPGSLSRNKLSTVSSDNAYKTN